MPENKPDVTEETLTAVYNAAVDKLNQTRRGSLENVRANVRVVAALRDLKEYQKSKGEK